MNDPLSRLIQEEEAKRLRNWDSALRWKVIQETITWAETQTSVRRNTKEACLANQRRLLASFATTNASSTVAGGHQ